MTSQQLAATLRILASGYSTELGRDAILSAAQIVERTPDETDCWHGVEKLAEQRNAAYREIDRLRAALEHYGRHAHPNCHDLTLKEDGSFGPRNGCLCGFDAAKGKGSPVETSRDEAAFEAGWQAAAEWAKREDLVYDIDSPAYRIDRFNRLKRLAVEPTPQRYRVQQDKGEYALEGCEDGDLVDWSAYEALLRRVRPEAPSASERPRYSCGMQGCPGDHTDLASFCPAGDSDK